MEILEMLARTPAIVAGIAAQVPESLVRVRSGPFALVEHVWHLGDLEREGFCERVRRLLAEEDPFLPDFDGERAAREREYLKLDLAPALAAFAAAREETLRRLRGVSGDQWERRGRQERVGSIALAELPRQILDHDLAHLNEIADLLADFIPTHPMITGLRQLAQDGPRSSRGV
jgi:hypothetical protein